MRIYLADLSNYDVLLFAFLILAVFTLLVGIFFISGWVRKANVGVSPYTGMPLRRCSELPYASAKKILQFLYERKEYDNRIIDLQKAAFCRDTGRIFPNCVSWFDTIKVDWSFLRKRFPGNYVSWGSLGTDQQTMISDAHDSLEGFQTQRSSPKPAPREVDAEYVFAKPGPLYVDMDQKILLGWQCVPETDFEVLIIQRPKKKDEYRFE